MRLLEILNENYFPCIFKLFSSHTGIKLRNVKDRSEDCWNRTITQTTQRLTSGCLTETQSWLNYIKILTGHRA